MVRTGWLVMTPSTPAGGMLGASSRSVTSVVDADEQRPNRREQLQRQSEVQQLVAQVSLVCPTSAAQLERELNAATGSITSIRVAQNIPARTVATSLTRSDSERWLIDPGDWFVPEDFSTSATSTSATSSPVPEPRQAPAPKRLLPPPPGGDVNQLPPVPPPVNSTVPKSAVGRATGDNSKERETGGLDGPALRLPTEAPAPIAPQTAAPEPTKPNFEQPVVRQPPASPETLPQPRATQESIEPRGQGRATAPAVPQRPTLEPTLAPAKRLPNANLSPPTESIPQPAAPQAESPFAPPAVSPHSPSDPQAMEDARAKARAAGVPDGEDPHAVLYAEGCYPSAKTCAKCHEKIYHEWSASSHAYAAVSPMFQKFEQKITDVSKGTVGYFCLRCHSPVGTSLRMPRDLPLWDQPEVAREGVTCVACHRVNQRYGKANGERHIIPGDVYAPVYGGKGGVGVAEVIANKETYKVKTSPAEKGPGQPIHREGRYFDQLSASEYCTSCHQVAVHPGIKLEVVWEQYRASPARKAGVTCQDCHMGRVPGVPSGYECCAIAEIAGQKVRDHVKHSNHLFYGPGYSIAHPGIFPFHLKSDRWKFQEWLQFDWRAGWGTKEFEKGLAAGELRVAFPPIWANVDDRYDAREIINDNLKKLAGKTEVRRAVMENGSHVDGPFFDTQPRVGRALKLHYVVTNTNTGHNLPTASLGAQPQLWANVVLIGPRGQRLWETGYTDHYGDVCDIHSRDVRQGRVPFDSQLFNLQTMFLITGAVGTDREFYLPVNVDIDQLPFLRPGNIPVSVTNHPPFIRMESRSIAPLGKKKVKYRIPGDLICEPGRYRLTFRMRSRAEPIYFMDFCGATAEMQRAMNEGVIDVHPYSVEFDVR